MKELTQRPVPTIHDIAKKVRETIHEGWHPEKPADYPCYYCRLWDEYKMQACFYCIHNPDCGMFLPEGIEGHRGVAVSEIPDDLVDVIEGEVISE